MAKTCTKCNNPRFSKGLCLQHYKIEYKEKFQLKKTPIKQAPIKPIKSKPYTISKVSKKGLERQKKYQELRLEYLREHPICEVCKIALATEIHHRKKRHGDNMFKYFLSVCHHDHVKIENNPTWAFENGYSIPINNKNEK